MVSIFIDPRSTSRENGPLPVITAIGGARKSRKENTFFDYVKRLARIRKETPDAVENKVRSIPSSTIRDVLTGIHYLRENSDTIKAPVLSEIYSDEEGLSRPVQA